MHYLTPSLMGTGLVFSALVAVAHHLFYQSLDGYIVGSDSQQQWYLRIGTGLAFLFKTSLTASAGLAYAQLLWYILRAKPISVNGANSFFGALSNVVAFSSRELWVRGPALAATAMIIWLLPLAAIIPPGTLTVHAAAQQKVTTQQTLLPSISYDRLAEQRWSGAQGPRLSRLAMAAAQGAILQITPPFPNCTYSVEFWGPSYSCIPGNSSFPKAVVPIVNQHFDLNWYERITYVGWVPADQTQDAIKDEEKAILDGFNHTVLYPTQADVTLQFDRTSSDHARFFIYYPWNDQVLECGLFNTSYAAQFSFNQGHQDIQLTKKAQLHGVNGSIAAYVLKDNMTADPLAMFSLVDTINTILVGYLGLSKHLRYPTATRTLIANTALTQVQELAVQYNDTAPMTIANMTTSEALEELVQNITLSLFSDPYFLQNASTANQGNITVLTSQNAYQYSPLDLWISYSVGLFCASVIIIVGFVCIFGTGASFDTSFSTILRTTRDPGLEEIVPADQTKGMLPLSKELGLARVGFRHHDEQATEGSSSSAVAGFYVCRPVSNVDDARQVNSMSQVGRRLSMDSLLRSE